MRVHELPAQGDDVVHHDDRGHPVHRREVHPRPSDVEARCDLHVEHRLDRTTAAGAVEARLGAVVADAPPSWPVDCHREPQLFEPRPRCAGGLDSLDRVVVTDVVERSVQPRGVEELLTRARDGRRRQLCHGPQP